jgi:methylated-DNA-[protein]-cysteine S-methyltransferase
MLDWCEAEFGGDVRLRITAGEAGIRSVEFHPAATAGAPNEANPALQEAVRQLTAYFAGELRAFELPLDPVGTDFQKRVWQELLRIPYGVIRSYRQIAEAIGSPQAVRAVGAANGANPIAIVVPCHRVVGAGGRLVGYGGGLDRKQQLLALEQAALF